MKCPECTYELWKVTEYKTKYYCGKCFIIVFIHIKEKSA